MRAVLVKGYERAVADAEYLLVDRAVVGDLDQRVADAHVVVLVRAHEAA